MSSTNLAYAVVGVCIPFGNLFTAGRQHMECRTHGIGKGSFCQSCGKRLDVRFKRIPTPEMTDAAVHYGINPGPLWDLMREKSDEHNNPAHNNPAPLAWWCTKYDYYSGLTDEDSVVLGLHLVKTPYMNPNGAYPVADVPIDRILRLSREAKEHLANFGITEEPQLFVFAYC